MSMYRISLPFPYLQKKLYCSFAVISLRISWVKRFLLTPEQGARAVLALATSPEMEGVTGKYFIKGRQGRSVPISYDEALQQRVWDMSADLVGLEHSVVRRS